MKRKKQIVPKALADRIHEAYIPYQELAEASGCTTQHIRMILRGERTPGLDIARKIANRVGLPLDTAFPPK